MTQHARSQHTYMIERVPNANQGRDHPGLKIFGMQGVPRIEIEAWVHKQVKKYWGKKMEKKIEAERAEIEEKRKKIEA